MKKSKFSDSQIIETLKLAQGRVLRCPNCAVSRSLAWQRFNNGGQIRRDGRVADGAHEETGGREARLKKMYAEERLKSEILQEAMAKKW